MTLQLRKMICSSMFAMGMTCVVTVITTQPAIAHPILFSGASTTVNGIATCDCTADAHVCGCIIQQADPPLQ